MDVTTPPVPLPSAPPESSLETLEVDDLSDVFVCLRGPCSHYVEQLSPANVHNAEENLRQVSRTCLLLKADLTDDLVLDCSRWEPPGPIAQSMIKDAREAYWKLNPHHDPRTADTTRLTQIRRSK